MPKAKVKRKPKQPTIQLALDSEESEEGSFEETQIQEEPEIQIEELSSSESESEQSEELVV